MLVILPAIEPSLVTLIVPFLLFFKTESSSDSEINFPSLVTYNVPSEL